MYLAEAIAFKKGLINETDKILGILCVLSGYDFNYGWFYDTFRGGNCYMEINRPFYFRSHACQGQLVFSSRL